MENEDHSEAKINQEVRDGSKDGKKGAIEYFLTKLKRVDAEIVASNAELREIDKEISRKEFKIERLKMRLENLMREEMNREIKRLEQMKNQLKENVKKADRVLAGLGLIWVGERAAGTNVDLGVRFIGSPEGSFYRPDPGFHEITKERTNVTPFSGPGYRLGTGSEIFEPRTNQPDVEQISEQTRFSFPLSGRSENANNAESSPMDSLSFGLSRTSSDKRIWPVEGTGLTKIKSLEELPLEFRRMSKSARRRALKQVSVQIQKNMNKYI